MMRHRRFFVRRADAEEVRDLRRRVLELEGLLCEVARDGLVARKEEEIHRLNRLLSEATGQKTRYDEALSKEGAA